MNKELTNYNQRFNEVAQDNGMDWLLQIIPQEIKVLVAVCKDRKKNHAFGRIARNHNIPRSTVFNMCKKCKGID